MLVRRRKRRVKTKVTTANSHILKLTTAATLKRSPDALIRGWLNQNFPRASVKNLPSNLRRSFPRIVFSQMVAVATPRAFSSHGTGSPPVQAFAKRPEFDLLLACCAHSSGHAPADRIRKILSRPLDWQRVLRLVDHHRIIPQVYGELAAFSSRVPVQQLGALRSRYRENACKALWFTAELVRILSHLESVGIQALPYKGPVLAKTLYGEVTQRQFGDLDVLIHPADAQKAKTALLDLGYKPSIELPRHIESTYLKTAYEYSFSTAHSSNLLELQWRITPSFYSIDLDVANFFNRAEEISLGVGETEDEGPRPSLCVTTAAREFAPGFRTKLPLKKGNEASWERRESASEYSPRHKSWTESGLFCPARTLCGEDLLLVLCVHAAKHVWVQLSWLCDIAQLAKSEHLDWKAIQGEARRLGVERIVSLNLLLTHRLLGSALPPTIQKCLQDDPSTTALADEILSIIERSTHYNTESISYFRLMLRLRERWQDRARFLWRLVLTPSVSEWSTVRLPKLLHPLYRVVRLSRLANRLRVRHLWCFRSAPLSRTPRT